MHLLKEGDLIELPSGRNDKMQAIELSYQGERLSMLLILPAPGTFSEFEQTLIFETLENITGSLGKEPFDQVSLPRFTFSTNPLSLREILKTLGMAEAFDESKADFSGIDGRGAGEGLFISEVFHKGFIAVDEKGTEAAAATAVIIADPGGPYSFVADRPFIFLIRDRQTGVVLFMGRVLVPVN
jgi:serpin B